MTRHSPCFRLHFAAYIFQEYPVREIKLGTLGTRLGDAKGMSGTLKLLWNQTYPIFRPPYIGNVILLFYVSIASYVAAHGFYMW